MLAIQKFINSDLEAAGGYLLEGFTSEFKSSGVNTKLLEKFYNKRLLLFTYYYYLLHYTQY